MPRRKLPLLAAAALATGCATGRVATEAQPGLDFDRFQTFAVLGGVALSPEGQVDAALGQITARVDQALTAQLEARGLRRSPDAPDLLVRYVATAEARRDYQPEVHTGYPWTGGEGLSRPRVRAFTEGTVVVDLIDARSGKLVWRATASAELRSLARGSRPLDAALARAFRSFPHGPHAERASPQAVRGPG